MVSEMQGDTVTLDVTVIDKNGFLINPNSLTVYIFPYGKDPALRSTDKDVDYVDDGTPDLLSTGKFTYDFAIPEDAQVGIWYAYWTGTIGTSAFRSITRFEVASSGNSAFSEYQNPLLPVLNENNIYKLRLIDVEDIEGNETSAFYWFTSRYNPMYSTYENVLSRILSIVSNVNKDAINFLIWKSSREADLITMPGCIVNRDYYNFARKQYVEICTVISMLRSIVGSAGTLKAKSLGDLSVEYNSNSNALDQFIKNQLKELEEWERVLNASGSFSKGAGFGLKSAQPGIYHPDRDTLGRSIKEPVGSPIASNTKALVGNRTRWQHAFYPSGTGRSDMDPSPLSGWHYE